MPGLYIGHTGGCLPVFHHKLFSSCTAACCSVVLSFGYNRDISSQLLSTGGFVSVVTAIRWSCNLSATMVNVIKPEWRGDRMLTCVDAVVVHSSSWMQMILGDAVRFREKQDKLKVIQHLWSCPPCLAWTSWYCSYLRTTCASCIFIQSTVRNCRKFKVGLRWNPEFGVTLVPSLEWVNICLHLPRKTLEKRFFLNF